MSTNNIEELVEAVMTHGPEILYDCASTDIKLQNYFMRLDHEHLNYPRPSKSIETDKWYIPREYEQMDIEDFLMTVCPQENHDRLLKELTLYRQQNMMPVLKTMKYIVDTLRKNNVVWGVGRGSSVASYVLFLLGVHRIDSVKYNLPIEEFFKEIENG